MFVKSDSKAYLAPFSAESDHCKHHVNKAQDCKDCRIATLQRQLSEVKAERDEAREECERLRRGYAEAVEDLEDWAAYATEYFQQKHNLAGTLEEHRAVLSAIREKGNSNDV